MTTPSRIRNSIDELLTLLVHKDIALLVNTVVQRGHASASVRVSWPSQPDRWRSAYNLPFGSIEQYYGWLESGEYSAILYDGAILQLSFDFWHSDLVGHCLAYYPCPFRLSNEELSEFRERPVNEVLYQYLDDFSRFRARSPLRFDFDERAATPEHPASHLTLVKGDCRWAVFGPLSLGHFVTFVFRHFYPSLWQQHEFIREWPMAVSKRTLPQVGQRELCIWAHDD